MVTKTIHIRGMTCAACVSHVTDAIESVPGVESAEVSLATNSANVGYAFPGSDDDKRESALFESINEAVKEAGYSVNAEAVVSVDDAGEERQTVAAAQRSELVATRNQAFISVAAALMMMSLTMFSASVIPEVPRFALNLILLIIAAPIQLRIAAPFYRSAWAAAKRKTSNMNTLVVVGTSIAFTYSALVTVSQLLWGDDSFSTGTAGFTASGHHTGTYFEVSAAIIGLVSLGRWLEGRTRLRATEAVKMLVGLQPRTALVEHEEGVVEVNVGEIAAGDVVVVRPGERVPVDARVMEGSTEVDESMLTGESVPVLKTAGEMVFAGTMNVGNACRARVTTTGDQTLLAQIIEQVERAQATKAPIERFVDRVTAKFVPIVLIAGTASFLFWIFAAPEPSLTNALLIAVTVFVIACPCALGLATPTAVVAGIGRAAEHGILIKDATALERTAAVDTVAFDKTGTLTLGRPEVLSIDVPDGSEISENDALRLAAAVEIYSEHPVAKAVVKLARERGISIPDAGGFQSITGKGVYATVEGATVAVMNPSAIWIEEDSHIANAITRIETEAQTPVTVSINSNPIAAIGLHDPIRPDATTSITSLRNMGIEPQLITGDKKPVAIKVAEAVGIDNVYAEVLPSDKASKVTERKADGRRVAMIGDGVNDGPALATADVGIAMASGSDIAIETADVTLINDEPGAVAKLMTISRATVRVIRQNLFWAFAYNVVLIPIAAGALHPFFNETPPPEFLRLVISENGFLSPVAAALAMALSSLSVSLNALRLRRKG